MRSEDIIDAEFTVITPARKPFNWGRIHFGWSWEGFFVCAIIGLPRLIYSLLAHHS